MAGSSRKRSSSANGKSSRKKTKSETKMWSKKKASPEDQAAALFQELLVAEEPPAGEEDDPNTEIITIEGAYGVLLCQYVPNTSPLQVSRSSQKSLESIRSPICASWCCFGRSGH